MTTRDASFLRVNRGSSFGAHKSVASRNPSRVTRAAAAVVLAAMARGLSHREAVGLAATTWLAGVACVVKPEKASTVKARLYATTVGYVVAKRARRAA